ncbi:hypothetical protein BDY19DRAFT_905341 [Irpex rosettiformis]|uniref:Uncharacterized protein n=1 Tax=Irpex rosettiformis TaxID=378272 RepID=A0ACB8U7V2_9APHY|nr:hypothetical protein BDY19DRAFT_905341 [Irpex rosettiformis]
MPENGETGDKTDKILVENLECRGRDGRARSVPEGTMHVGADIQPYQQSTNVISLACTADAGLYYGPVVLPGSLSWSSSYARGSFELARTLACAMCSLGIAEAIASVPCYRAFPLDRSATLKSYPVQSLAIQYSSGGRWNVQGSVSKAALTAYLLASVSFNNVLVPRIPFMWAFAVAYSFYHAKLGAVQSTPLELSPVV